MAEEIDVLVVGAGAGGLAAAIAAHDLGASVAVVEKLDRPGGNSSLSTGSVPAAASRFQKEAGIDDSPKQFFEDLMRISGGSDCPDLVRRLVDTSAETVEWLVDTVGARLVFISAYKHIGHTRPRLHAPASRRGQDLVDDLVSAAETRGIPIAVGNSVRSLIVEDHEVKGVEIDLGDGEAAEIRAGKVILAVNGFAANPDLVARFCPDIAGAAYFGARGSTGEAILWGEALGAELGNMGAYQGYAAVADPHGSLLSWTTIEKGGILLNRDGERFGDESRGYSGFTPTVMAQGGPCYALFDQRIFDIASAEEEFTELWSYGGLKRGETPEEALAAYGLDPANVAREFAAYQASSLGTAPDRFGRRDFGIAPLSGPFYACRVVPGLFHTQGGLKVDGDGRVLRQAGGTVPNLYAIGGAAAGLSGRSGAAGYASGNGLLSAIGLGRLAGLAAAREAIAETGAAAG